MMSKPTKPVVVKYNPEEKSEILNWLRANVLDDGNSEIIQMFLMELHNKIRDNE